MNVLIVDDHSVIRKGLQVILKNFSADMHTDEAADGTEALRRMHEQDYDLLILDITLPDMNGIDVLQHIKDSGIKTRCLVFSFHPEEVFASEAFRLGAAGYLNKNKPYGEIIKAIHKVSEGGKYVSAELAERLAFANEYGKLPHEKLSEKEFQVFLMLAGGKSVTEIAKSSYIPIKTVSTYRAGILKKMNMASNADLTIYAIKKNLIIT